MIKVVLSKGPCCVAAGVLATVAWCSQATAGMSPLVKVSRDEISFSARRRLVQTDAAEETEPRPVSPADESGVPQPAGPRPERLEPAERHQAVDPDEPRRRRRRKSASPASAETAPAGPPISPAIFFLQLGFGGVPAANKRVGPAICGGFRIPVARWLAFDLSCFYLKIGAGDNSGRVISFRFLALGYFDSTANHGLYFGAGLGLAHGRFGSYEALVGPTGALSLGFEFFRDSAFRPFFQVDAVLPFSYYQDDTARRFWGPALAFSVGVGLPAIAGLQLPLFRM